MTLPSSEQSETMRVALDMACDELRLREADAFNRARVASAIRTLAQAGQEDAEHLKTYAVRCVRSSR